MRNYPSWLLLGYLEAFRREPYEYGLPQPVSMPTRRMYV